MKKQNQLQHIIWAIDPFQTTKKLEQALQQSLAAITKTTQAVIEPVFVLTLDYGVLEFAPASKADWKKRFQENAEKQTQLYVKRFKLKNIATPKVLLTGGSSPKQAINELCTYSESVHADLIVVSSHARSGLSRLFMGSFAETLLLSSRIPTLVVNPKNKPKSKFKNILFPTDLTQESEDVFQAVVQFAKKNSAKIKLFHKISSGLEPVLASSITMLGGGWVPVKSYFADQADEKEKLAQRWAHNAAESGVKVSVIIDRTPGSIPDAIFKAAKRNKSELIALASQSGAVATKLLGSITRQVIRQSSEPVWVLHATEHHSKSDSKDDDFKPSAMTKASTRVVL